MNVGGTGGSAETANGGSGPEAVGGSEHAAGGSGPEAVGGSEHAAGGSGSSEGGGLAEAGSGGTDPEAMGGAGGVSAGDTEACRQATDCILPETVPPNCAQAVCAEGKCTYEANDEDGDGFKSKQCTSRTPGVSVSKGDDCNDLDSAVSPNGWDGPKGDGFENGCGDDIDQDCNGVLDDGQLTNGGTCTCTPGETAACASTASGEVIHYPKLEAVQPLGTCKMGSRQCLAGGVWGTCTGAVAPQPESCDGNDNDCDGIASADEKDAAGQSTFDCDADLDGYAPQAGAIEVIACQVPATGCAGGKWLMDPASAVRADCDDTDQGRHPGAVDHCDGIDQDCNGSVTTGCGCTVGEARPCGTHPEDGIAACRAGVQKCDGAMFGACEGSVGPEAERCDTYDRDCDGTPGYLDADMPASLAARGKKAEDLYGCERTRRFTLEVVTGNGFTGKLQPAPAQVDYTGGATPEWQVGSGAINGIPVPTPFFSPMFPLHGNGSTGYVHIDLEALDAVRAGSEPAYLRYVDAFENGGTITLNVITDSTDRTLTLKLGSEPYP